MTDFDSQLDCEDMDPNSPIDFPWLSGHIDKTFSSVISALNKTKEFESTCSINKKTIEYLLSIYKSVIDNEDLKEQFCDIARFVLLNQNYCSPSSNRPNSLVQTGHFQTSQNVKYLRSESGVALFGQTYDRNQVLIRSNMFESFAQLCQTYMSPCNQDGSKDKSLFNYIDARYEDSKDVLTLIEDDFKAGIKIILLRSSQLESIELKDSLDLLTAKYPDTVILVEQPFIINDEVVLGVSFISLIDQHQQPLRYQMLQDAASMGYRPYTSDVFDHLSRVGTLDEYINENLTNRGELSTNRRQSVPIQQEYTFERTTDWKVLQQICLNCLRKLSDVRCAEILEPIKEYIQNEILRLQAIITSELNDDNFSQIESISEFNKVYYALRPVVQYCGFLAAKSELSSDHTTQSEDSTFSMQLNSGMTAYRLIFDALKDVSTVYSTEHYWEIDFLIQNYFEGNPHYQQPNSTKNQKTIRLTGNSDLDIQGYANLIIQNDQHSESGQLACLDQTIAPFFYTKTFSVDKLCAAICDSKHEFKNPLYILIDNTVDFLTINANSLFPNGIPKNVFVFEASSFAKLHQFGFDIVTGGGIKGACNPINQQQLRAIESKAQNASLAEDSGQSPYGMHVMDIVFGEVIRSNNQDLISDYMIDKRRRNGKIFFNEIDLGNFGKTITIQDGNIIHKVSFDISYEPSSGAHIYIKLNEDKGPPFISTKLFDKIKEIFIQKCDQEGLQIADGTSWGFRNTRLDSYMHTMRVAIGLEHQNTVQKIAQIFSQTISQIIANPNIVSSAAYALPLTSFLINNQFKSLDTLLSDIPGFNQKYADAEEYFKDNPSLLTGSLVAIKGGHPVGILLSKIDSSDSKIMYVDKASVNPNFRKMGILTDLLNQLKENAINAGCQYLQLKTSASQSNEYVVRAYEKNGFIAESNFTIEWQNDDWPLILVTMNHHLMNQHIDKTKFTPVNSDEYERLRQQRKSKS